MIIRKFRKQFSALRHTATKTKKEKMEFAGANPANVSVFRFLSEEEDGFLTHSLSCSPFFCFLVIPLMLISLLLDL